MLFPTKMLYGYAAYEEVPEFVKSAEFFDQEAGKLPDASFADTKRQYPIHTKAAAWLSALKMYNNDLDDATETNIIKAAEFWGIKDELPRMAKVMENSNKRPILDDTDFAVVVKRAGKTLERRFPLTEDEDVVEAANGFDSTYSIYPLEIRKQAASRILKAAADKNVSLPNLEKLQMSAGLGIAEIPRVINNLKYREKVARVSDGLKSVCDEIADEPVLHGVLQEKVAEALDRFDREHGLFRFYDTIPTPEEVCYSTSLSALEKSASALRLRDGSMIPRERIKNAKASRFAALGSDFMDNISDSSGNVDMEAFEAIVPTLPLDDTEILKKVI